MLLCSFCVYIFYLTPRYKIEDVESFKLHEYSTREGLQRSVFATAWHTTQPEKLCKWTCY